MTWSSTSVPHESTATARTFSTVRVRELTSDHAIGFRVTSKTQNIVAEATTTSRNHGLKRMPMAAATTARPMLAVRVA